MYHKPTKSSLAQIRRLASQVDGTRLWETHLRPILIERLPGTKGSKAVQKVCRRSSQFRPLTTCFSQRCFPSPAALFCFSTSPPHSPRCLLAGTSTWIPFTLQHHEARSRSPTSWPLWSPLPLAGSPWPATMTLKPYLQTLVLQGGSSWERATRLCRVP